MGQTGQKRKFICGLLRLLFDLSNRFFCRESVSKLKDMDNWNISRNSTTNSTESQVPRQNEVAQPLSTVDIIIFTICFFGFVSNIFVIAIIAIYVPMHKQSTNVFIVNQSIIDASVAVFLFLTTKFNIASWELMAGNLADEVLCKLWYSQVLLWSMMTSTAHGVVAVTFDRFLAVVYPIWYKTKYSGSKIMVGITITLTWTIAPIFNLAFTIPTTGVSSHKCNTISFWPNDTIQVAVGVLNNAIQYLLPLCLIVYGYSKMAFVLHRRAKIAQKPAGGGSRNDNKDGAGKATNHKENGSMSRAKSNVLKTMALVAFFFVFCWTPNQIYYLTYIAGYPLDFSGDFYNFTVILLFVNCCVNPVIYCIKYEQFKRGVMWVLCREKVGTSDKAT